MGHLEANLHALAQHQRELALRLCWPVSAEQVRQTPAGLERLHRRAWQALALDATQLQERATFVQTAARPVIFGVGDAQALTTLLEAGPTPALTVWERDPWLLRLWLDSTPLSEPLVRGRLRLALGSDLLALCADSEVSFWGHPVAKHQYAPEWQLVLQRSAARERVVVACGELMVDGLTEAFREVGYDVWPLDLTLLSVEELAHQVRATTPRALAVINYRQGLAEFCEQLALPLLIWEIDPTTDRLQPLASTSRQSFFFTYRESQRPTLEDAGFCQIAYLPLATHPRLRAPAKLDEGERARYEVPIAFVGSSMVDQLERHRREWLALCQSIPGAPNATWLLQQLEQLLRAQATDYTRNRVPELWAELFPMLDAATTALRQDPLQLIGEMAAAAKRLHYLRALAHQGLHVWGDAGFAELGQAGINYRGPAGYTHEINKIYSHAQINLDIGRLYQSDIVTLRVFDVLACGGFVLCERHPVLSALFVPGRELDVYGTTTELCEKVAYYRAHPELARAMAQAGQQKVLTEHTLTARVRTMLAHLPRAR